MKILRIDSSARTEGAKSRQLIDRFLQGLGSGHAVRSRDLSTPIPQIDINWIAANTTPEEERKTAHRQALSLSDHLIEELEDAEMIVIGLSVYNFTIPAALKAWIDQVCRARRTFRYTEDGPKGLLSGKRAVVVYASGGTALGSDIDFASDYMRHILNFIGIDDVTFVDAGGHLMDEKALTRAEAELDELAAHVSRKGHDGGQQWAG